MPKTETTETRLRRQLRERTGQLTAARGALCELAAGDLSGLVGEIARRGLADSEPGQIASPAALLGSMTSAAKARAARENGKLGGRPKKKS